jgi:hypothetical protein
MIIPGNSERIPNHEISRSFTNYHEVSPNMYILIGFGRAAQTRLFLGLLTHKKGPPRKNMLPPRTLPECQLLGRAFYHLPPMLKGGKNLVEGKIREKSFCN